MARKASSFTSGYKTYDPQSEGYGNASEWVGDFYTRLGFDEAEVILAAQEETPHTILGVSPKATWAEIKKAYRAKAMECHPDRCAHTGMAPDVADAMFKKIGAAFTVLENRMGK